MNTLTGIAAANGIAIAKAYHLVMPDLSYTNKTATDTDQEISRLDASLETSISELEKIKEHAKVTMGEAQAEIFSAHLLILQDPELIAPMKEKITNNNMSAEAALDEVVTEFVTIFENMDNAYMRERAADIKDVSSRVKAHLIGVDFPDPALIDEEVVVIAHDLTPSDTAQLDRKFVKGFATDIGGRTSHSAIMARSLDIPAVVGTQNISEEAHQNDMVIVDGLEGKVLVNPDDSTLETYRNKQTEYEAQRTEWAKLKDEPTFTADGEQVLLGANIGNPGDVDSALENGAEAIGLYRTEFLYMGRSEMPTEEEQYEAYKTVLEKMEGKPVVVRTLDIGGDKNLDYLELPEEMNPFLGFRAIRFCLENEDIFRPQLRALLRASAHGRLQIMFPMIATLDELKKAKALLAEEKKNLTEAGHSVSDDIEVGIMVEIPSTAVMAKQFAKEVDFFSIGTNDLIQYTMAADRMNQRVSYLYQPYNPAILTLVHNVIEAAHAEGKWVGMCGEMGGDPQAIPMLLGLGLDEFSMSATSILPARTQLLGLSKKEVASYTDKILAMSSAEEVVTFINSKTQKS
ncbi:Phosphoenolpyruvate--protein phosphotransferase [Lentibacillus sp. JNUCC-1]|uniref:phosphoenolpyruvate--protein phosphotransferase n=1 Tax=Lentibacillus sp. JNUCC-1 TaxID=2654513 RepID=UPI0012E7D4F3|nr:phosphoenolpyruvate--protein phosphotransferase [Lentibacillus sp. JNUCC-1]MUV39125.1 Phosphoenolpyruvate--protein phosphotransferase [Lentibacillus sp. JNUCC-1]